MNAREATAPVQHCSELVVNHAAGASGHGHACRRKATVLSDGKWWCALHSPAARERRYAVRKARDEGPVMQPPAHAVTTEWEAERQQKIEKLLAILDAKDAEARRLIGHLLGDRERTLYALAAETIRELQERRRTPAGVDPEALEAARKIKEAEENCKAGKIDLQTYSAVRCTYAPIVARALLTVPVATGDAT